MKAQESAAFRRPIGIDLATNSLVGAAGVRFLMQLLNSHDFAARRAFAAWVTMIQHL
jgi:hypothetical protein